MAEHGHDLGGRFYDAIERVVAEIDAAPRRFQPINADYASLPLPSVIDSLLGWSIVHPMIFSPPSGVAGAAGANLRHRKLVPVDPRVRERLREIAAKHALCGVRVFLFGSVARTWPEAHVGADLDLGYEIDRSRGDQDVRRRELERDVETLPSIRPVDLVDFSQTSEAFRAQAIQHTVELAHESSATTAA